MWPLMGVVLRKKSEKALVLSCMDCRSIGTTSLVADVAASCRFLHLHVDLRRGLSITDVVPRYREFFPDDVVSMRS